MEEVGLAVYLEREGQAVRKVALAAMGVDAMPVRLGGAEELLLQGGLSEEAIGQAHAAAVAQIEPMADIYTSAAYRKHALGSLLTKALGAAAAGQTENGQ